MKRFSAVAAVLLLVFASSCGFGGGHNESGVTLTASQTQLPAGNRGELDMKAVWVSQYELSMKGRDCTKEEFEIKAEQIAANASGAGLNTLIVQVHPNSDALYSSDIFPASEYLSGVQGKEPGFDALSIMLEAAKRHGLSLHAWINPFRVSAGTDFSLLSENNPARIWYEQDSQTDSLIICDKGIYYNPSSAQAVKLVLDCVRELTDGYELDGIHIDDYFYPVTDESIDSAVYASYLSAGGVLSLGDYRRECVNGLVASMYSIVKKSGGVFSVSPSGDIEKNREVLYADVEKWLSHDGFADYIIPQIYFGFENSSMPFASVAAAWAELQRSENVKLCCGLAAYKADCEDAYAGSGVNEWREHNDVLSRQIEFIKDKGNFSGAVFFSYSSLFSDNMSENVANEVNLACQVLA